MAANCRWFFASTEIVAETFAETFAETILEITIRASDTITIILLLLQYTISTQQHSTRNYLPMMMKSVVSFRLLFLCALLLVAGVGAFNLRNIFSKQQRSSTSSDSAAPGRSGSSGSSGSSSSLNLANATSTDVGPASPSTTTAVRTSVRLSMLDNNNGGDANTVLSLLEKARSTDLLVSLANKASEIDAAQVLTNLRSGGELGTRGELYVAGQFALVGAILFGIDTPIVSFVGPILLIGGLVAIALSLLDLGTDSLTPFLTPTEAGSLKTKGIYKYVRHPLYAGLVASMAGISLVSNSADRLIITVALYALVNTKAGIEEDYLKKDYPEEYSEYMVSIMFGE